MQDGHFIFIFTWNLSNADASLDRHDGSVMELLNHNQMSMLYCEMRIGVDMSTGTLWSMVIKYLQWYHRSYLVEDPDHSGLVSNNHIYLAGKETVFVSLHGS